MNLSIGEFYSMAQSRRKQRVEPEVQLEEPAKPEDEEETQESLRAIPELMRRAIALGLTGFFTTEEAVRRALGDTVPKDWTDYIAESSDRTRSEFLDRLSREIAQTLKDVDIAAVLQQLLEGRTLRVNAEFSLSDEPGTGSGASIRLEKEGDTQKS
jgi:N-acyl-D-aspartate/D-glutamate deacylase